MSATFCRRTQKSDEWDGRNNMDVMDTMDEMDGMDLIDEIDVIDEMEMMGGIDTSVYGYCLQQSLA